MIAYRVFISNETFYIRDERSHLTLCKDLLGLNNSYYHLDTNDENVDVGDRSGNLQISAVPLGHRVLVENVVRELVAQVADELDPVNKKAYYRILDRIQHFQSA